jgi:hypothetical protein
MSEIKNYIKKAIQPMRPYIPGEDLTGVSVSEEDTPELGGMIATGSDNEARWYVSKGFFEANYVPVLQPHEQRVADEKEDLDEKAKALSEFIGNSPVFETLDHAGQERMRMQNDIMWQYSEILGERIAAFTSQ